MKPPIPTLTDADRVKARISPPPALSDTDRLNALLAMFGGSYAFSIGVDLPNLFRHGRQGIDELVAANPHLVQAEKSLR